MFYVGQKVVCVSDEPKNPCVLNGRILADDYWPNFPKKGKIYTVRGFFCDDPDLCGIYLVELINPVRHYTKGFVEGGFRAENFRPLEERKTDISIFTEMLKDKELAE